METIRGKMEKRAFTKISLGTFFTGLFWAATFLLVRAMSTRFPKMAEGSQIIELLISLATYGVAILIMWLFLRGMPVLKGVPKQRMSFLSFLGYACSMRGVAMILSLVGIVVFLLVALAVKGPEDLMKSLFESNPFFPESPMSMATDLILICIAAPLFEELMFRRLLLDVLRPFGDTVAVIYSGIAFGLLHMNFQQFFYAAGLGLMLGYVMVRTNNIWYCIGLHAVFNSMSVLFLPLLNNLDMENVDIMSLSALWIMLGVILMISVIGIVLFIVNVKKIRLEKPRFRFSIPIGFKLVFLNAGTIPYALVCLLMAVHQIYII